MNNSNNQLDKLFYPKSIAVIGASDDTQKIGGFIFSQILKVKDKNKINLYPINIGLKKVQNISAYPNVKNVKEKIDLAIIAIPQKFVIDTLKDCAEKKVKNVIIISAGFKEVGEKGKQAEEEIKKIVKENNMNLVGPNCLGILNCQTNLNCSFAKECSNYGKTAFISQSGAIIDAVIDWSFKKNVGLSKVVSLGNMAGINSTSILEYLKDDPKTQSIVFYMETLENGKQFAKTLKEVTKKKPVIIIKPGNSAQAQKAIGSHTGSLAQDNILVKTLIQKNNGIYVETLDELYNVLIALKSKYYQKNNNLVILTNAGGPGVIATDSVEQSDFNLYQLSEKQKQKFNQLPSSASLNNPIDIIGDARSDRYKHALENLIKIKDLSHILILLTPQIMTDSLEISKIIAQIKNKTNKNIFVSFLGDKQIKESLEFLDKNNIASFTTPCNAIKSMNRLLTYSNFKYSRQSNVKFNHDKIKKIQTLIKEKNGLLDYNTTKKVLNSLDINIIKKHVLRKKEDVLNMHFDPKFEYVVKVDSNNLLHKKDKGGLKTQVKSVDIENVVFEMFDKFKDYDDNFTITIEKQVKGIETIVGLKSDNNLGNFIVFGMGGTYVNIFKDININTAPINLNQAKELVENSKVFKLLNGYRGDEKINFEKLYDFLIKVSYLQDYFPQIKEVDFNPVICNKKDIYLVDVKLIINS